jgi:hypothetical protein
MEHQNAGSEYVTGWYSLDEHGDDIMPEKKSSD